MSDAAADTIVSHFGPEWERIDPYVWLHRGLNAMRVGRHGGTRVSLASVVLNGRVHGRTPEQTAEDYDLSIEDVRGALAWAAAHPEEVESYLRGEDALHELGVRQTERAVAAGIYKFSPEQKRQWALKMLRERAALLEQLGRPQEVGA